MSLKEFLEKRVPLVDRLDRVLYSGSLLDKMSEAHTRTGDRRQAISEKVSPWFENQIKFGEWVKLSDKESFEEEIRKIYMEQQ